MHRLRMPLSTDKPIVADQSKRTLASHRAHLRRSRQPHRMPASSYYALAAASSIAVFFLLWGTLQDDVDTPWIDAGLAASVVLGSAVFIREILLMRTRRSIREAERQLDRSLSAFPASLRKNEDSSKITLERNSALVRHIARKSEAAKVLGRVPDGHREVFDLCDEYLRMVAMELPTVAVGSPRIAAFRHGNEVVRKYHRYHLMQWAEIEARSLTQEANGRDRITESLKFTEQAVEVVDFALRYYPHEPELLESLEVLNDLVDSLKVKELIEKAERSVKRGNLKRARHLYTDALYILDRSEHLSDKAGLAADRLRAEIGKLDV